MIKFLLLALLGLILGAGVWKAQNPEGTIDDLKSQANGTVDRLKSGVDVVLANKPEKEEEKEKEEEEETVISERLTEVEQQLDASNSDAQIAELQLMIDKTLAGNSDSLSEFRDALNERVAPMQDMTKAIAELDTALQDTRARTDASNVRLDTIDRRLELLVRRLDEQTTDADLQDVNNSLEGIQGDIGILREDIDRQRGVVTETLTGLGEETSNLNSRLNTLVSSATQTPDNADENGGLDGNSESEADGVNPSILSLSAGIDERLSGIEQRLATVNTDSRQIGSLSEQLEAARAKIDELEQQDAQARQSLEELNDSVATLTTAGESLSIESIQAQVRDQLALAQSQIDDSADSNNTKELESLVETTRSRIQSLEQRVQELPAASSEADDAVQTQNDLQAQIADLERRLGSLSDGADPTLENKVNDVKQQVEQLSAQGFVTQDELRAKGEPESVEYKIYFDRNSAEVTEDAARVLNSFIAQEKNRTTGVSIFGFTDRSGSAAYNQQLALQRATNVRSYLIQNGLDFTQIKALSGLGEDAAAAVLPDNSANAQQRVVVLYAAQP